MTTVRWIILGGMHDPGLTDAFVAAVTGAIPSLTTAQQRHPEWWEITNLQTVGRLVSSQNGCPGCSSDILSDPSPSDTSSSDTLPSDTLTPKTASPIGMIAFSAGVVAAVGYLHHWQRAGGQVAGLIAVDGWGVPLGQDYPCFRLSHDRFTHRSSMLLGGGTSNFYADPAVPHLTLWSAPQTVQGWQIETTRGYAVQPMSAIAYLAQAVEAVMLNAVTSTATTQKL